MEVIPVINCPDVRCAREKIEVAKTFLPHGHFLHLDVTDGAFTFHKTWNNPTEWANLRAPFKLEVHLMVEKPLREIEAWLAAGATRFIVHVETINENSLKEILTKCRRRGAEVMLSSRPETPTKKLEPYLKHFSAFQVLSVHPGPASQHFLPLTLEKIKWLRRKMPDAIIEVDGGITPQTAKRAARAGADRLVSASYIFKNSNPAEAYASLKDPKTPRSVWYKKSLEHRPGILYSMRSLTEKKLKDLEIMANRLREDVIKMVSHAGSGHIAGPLDMAEIFTAMYFHVLHHDPKRPEWPDRDRLVLSNGHICPVQYAALAHAGYFPVEELKTLRTLGTRLQGHPHRGSLPGVETTSGPLGSGISQATGMALAARLDHKKWRTYCLTSDGEHEEGNTWEAVMFAGKMRLNNLTVFVDRNNIQIDGFTENIMPLEPFRQKYESFNWHVLEVDGHSFEEVIAAANEAKAIYEKPTVIIAHTIPGKGVDFMENDYFWHSKTFKPGEAQKALAELRTLRGKIKSEHQ
jgi:transketolase